MPAKRVLILYYSFSSQTRNLLNGLSHGLEEQWVDVVWEQLRPVEPLRFPIGTVWGTLVMMCLTFFRKRFAVQPLSESCFSDWDLIILAGPTWSYNPSGPIMAMFDRDGQDLFQRQFVLPLISCRGYWRVHLFGLRRLLRRCGARVATPLIFSHPTPEPWRTIGVFLRLAGKVPQAGSGRFRRLYPRYGHSREQVFHAREIGGKLAAYLHGETESQEFDIPIPVPCDCSDPLR
ncbi:MAG: hypothetical protein H8E79_05740 [Desulfobulbaceae bacterium]|uniref:Uncharacterized protein n=1 Tax=Candidatus Desulfatifera sulfidica TaxID=2841691 RepID=A0A8J6N9M3_9BACT|nr:hypothetical protein [Candidatus Desulfatifera sulfidica]